MGQAEWTELTSNLTQASIKHGVTNGVDRPNGGGNFCYVMNSLTDSTGAVGFYVNTTGFTPVGSLLTVPDGSTSMRGAIRRVTSPGCTGFSAFLFACAQGGPPSVNDDAYMLGLSDEDPYKIILAKGPILSALNSTDENITILASGSSQYNIGDELWHHLRLDAIVNPNGDVILKVYENDLASYPLSSPLSFNWTNVAGFDADGYIDDVTQINSGSAPLWGGYCGFAGSFAGFINRRCAFDGIEALRLT